jgi:hypothetical protein
MPIAVTKSLNAACGSAGDLVAGVFTQAVSRPGITRPKPRLHTTSIRLPLRVETRLVGAPAILSPVSLLSPCRVPILPTEAEITHHLNQAPIEVLHALLA